MEKSFLILKLGAVLIIAYLLSGCELIQPSTTIEPTQISFEVTRIVPQTIVATQIIVVTPEPIPTATAEFASDGWKIYRNEKLGYSFHYPADSNIVIDGGPLNGVSIIGPAIDGDNWPLMGFGHPSNREEFRPPEGVDLEKWLIDHDMWTPNYPNISDFREADVQIAGVSAIHIRHRRSGQSYASDKYYFARDGQLYQVGFLHIGDKEDWDLYNHFLESIEFEQ